MDVKMTTNVQTQDAYKSYSSKQQVSKDKPTEATAVVYEQSTPEKKATYSVAKMSEGDRAALVEQLKAEQSNREQQLMSIVRDMMTKQAGAYDSVWKFLASGEFEVDAATKAQAQEDISENGYYGVKQTSERLFDFAMALAGDDVDKMKEMQAAVEKGFKLATKAWGRELPSISRDTMDAANKLFDDYYASREKNKNNITEE